MNNHYYSLLCSRDLHGKKCVCAEKGNRNDHTIGLPHVGHTGVPTTPGMRYHALYYRIIKGLTPYLCVYLLFLSLTFPLLSCSPHTWESGLKNLRCSLLKPLWEIQTTQVSTYSHTWILTPTLPLTKIKKACSFKPFLTRLEKSALFSPENSLWDYYFQPVSSSQ